ncbi:MAG: adenosine deaminase family protein [Gemmatimonadota bacterium]
MHIRGLTLLVFLAATRSLAAQAGATAGYMEAAREMPGLLLALLREMPKGADLHSHLSGAVYAESFITWAAEKGGCIELSTMRAVSAPCDSARGTVPAAHALQNDDFHGAIVDAWSMRNWSRAVRNGHDQFFGTFGKFRNAGQGRGGDMLTETVRRAASNRVSYLELMDTPDDGAAALGVRVGWDDDMTRMREKLRAAGHATVVAGARSHFARITGHQRERMQCGTTSAEAGCALPVRFLYQVLRGLAPEIVFTQILTAFEAASVDSLIVGFNLVMPEDGYVSMRDFPLHMRMIDYLHPLYPNVKISLHAGELTAGLVRPEGLRFHIRESIEKGHASRIGHGVAIMYEDNALETLELMAKRNIAVEICLTSNAGILNVSGREHPLRIYHAYGVPTMLATDDEGVSRSEMTLEYLRAVREHGLDYETLKAMARNSIEHAFVQEPIKARLRADLNRDFAAFEAKWGARKPPR